jgi:hypothetical protein
MGLGPTLVGGVIGALAGMVLHVIVESATDLEAPWFAVIIGLLTGLGVHQANKSLAGRVSYLRGAVAAAIALAAIVGSTPLISFVAKGREREAATAARRTTEGDEAPDAADADPSEAGDDAEAAAEDHGRTVSQGAEFPAHEGQPMRPDDFNVWQFVFMAIGTFIAYEFGRGTGATATVTSEPPSDEPPTATDPSN